MKNLALLIFFFGIAVLPLSGQSGDSSQRVEYHLGFPFERGIYLTIEDWKDNDPVAPENIITNHDINSPKFFSYLFRDGEFRYVLNRKAVEKISTDDIFGYCTGKEVYYGTDSRFEIIGAICLLREVEQVDTYSSYINPGKQEYSVKRNENDSGKKYLLDFKTGNKFKYKQKYLKDILERDPGMYQQYKDAKGRKDEKMFEFLHKFNKKHPIRFPVKTSEN